MMKQYHNDDIDIWVGANPTNPPVPIEGYSNHFEVQGPGLNWYLFVRKDEEHCFEVYKAVLAEQFRDNWRPESWVKLKQSIYWFSGPSPSKIASFIRSL